LGDIEADTRILLRVAYCAKRGTKKVAIRTKQYGGHFHGLHIEELCISFGVGKHFRQIPVHAIANSLKAEKSKPIMIHRARLS